MIYYNEYDCTLHNNNGGQLSMGTHAGPRDVFVSLIGIRNQALALDYVPPPVDIGNTSLCVPKAATTLLHAHISRLLIAVLAICVASALQLYLHSPGISFRLRRRLKTNRASTEF